MHGNSIQCLPLFYCKHEEQGQNCNHLEQNI